MKKYTVSLNAMWLYSENCKSVLFFFCHIFNIRTNHPLPKINRKSVNKMRIHGIKNAVFDLSDVTVK